MEKCYVTLLFLLDSVNFSRNEYTAIMFFFSEDPVTVAVPLSLPEVQTLLVSLRNVAAHPNFRAFIQVGFLCFLLFIIFHLSVFLSLFLYWFLLVLKMSGRFIIYIL